MNHTEAEWAALEQRLARLEQSTADAASQGDRHFVLRSAYLILFMQVGFALLEGGFVRRKNLVNILLKNFGDIGIAIVAFWVCGWAVASGAGDRVLGFSDFFLLHSSANDAQWIFQLSFVVTSCTITSGAIVERTRFSVYCLWIFVMSAFVYPVIARLVWSPFGYLSARSPYHLGVYGVVDYAGDSVVHLSGAMCGLVGTLVLGPRVGRFSKGPDSPAVPMHPNSPAMVLGGTLFLWLGWYGFNPGSTLRISQNGDVVSARIAVNTTLSAAFGCVVGILSSGFRTGWKRWKYDDVCNGVLGGLVAITGPCAVTESWEAVIIGAAGGLVAATGGSILNRLHIDDPVAVVPVHGFAGCVGLISCGLFAGRDFLQQTYGLYGYSYPSYGHGLFHGGGWELLGIHVLVMVVTIIWCGVASAVVFYILKRFCGMRVPLSHELLGLDASEHDLAAAELEQLAMMKSLDVRSRELENIVYDLRNADDRGTSRGESRPSSRGSDSTPGPIKALPGINISPARMQPVLAPSTAWVGPQDVAKKATPTGIKDTAIAGKPAMPQHHGSGSSSADNTVSNHIASLATSHYDTSFMRPSNSLSPVKREVRFEVNDIP